MNFEHFYDLYARTHFDEVKIIGKDIEKKGRPYHIVGMTLKEKIVEAELFSYCKMTEKRVEDLKVEV